MQLEGKDKDMCHLAYYYTYIMHSKLGEDINAIEKAEHYITTAEETNYSIEDAEDRKRMAVRLKDTKGYNLIMKANSEDEIQIGIEMCREAHMASNDNLAAELYYRIHERTAWQRICRLRK